MHDEYYFKEGCFIQEWHNCEQDPTQSIAHVRVEVGKTTKPHALIDTEERYVILSGEADVTVGDKSWPVKRGDVVIIPSGVAQNIRNVGESDLMFLAICSPRFQEKNYTEL